MCSKLQLMLLTLLCQGICKPDRKKICVLKDAVVYKHCFGDLSRLIELIKHKRCDIKLVVSQL